MAVVVLGLLSTAARADRAATAAENAALAAALEVPAECLESYVSTVDASWASTYVVYDDDCPEGDGVIMLHLVEGVWRNAYTGPAEQTPCPLDRAIPDTVARDLDLCFRPSSKIYMPYWDDRLKYKPKTLPQGAHGLISKLKWRSWGKPVATGTGIFDYVDAYERFERPVKISLSRRGYLWPPARVPADAHQRGPGGGPAQAALHDRRDGAQLSRRRGSRRIAADCRLASLGGIRTDHVRWSAGGKSAWRCVSRQRPRA